MFIEAPPQKQKTTFFFKVVENYAFSIVIYKFKKALIFYVFFLYKQTESKFFKPPFIFKGDP